jgi:hypothetical protein
MFEVNIEKYNNTIYLNIDKIDENNNLNSECSLIFYSNNKKYITFYITLNNTLINYLEKNKIINILIQEPISYDIERSSCKLELHHNMLIKLI